MNANETILAHKRQAELLFAAAVNANCEFDEVRQNAGWLRPDQIQDERVRRFWGLCLDGRPANQAALDCTLLFELAKLDNGINPIFGREAVYARAIVDDEYLITAINAASNIAQIATERKVEEVRQKVAELGAIAPSTAIEIPDSTEIGLKFISTLHEPKRVIKTGISNVDRALGGLSRKTLTLLAARPSMGKTTLAFQWALWNAAHGINVLLFSLEMSTDQLWGKVICGRAGVDPEKYKADTMTPEEEARIQVSLGQITDELSGRLRIDDNSSRDSAFIWQACAQYRPDLLIVDHLALVKDKHENEVIRLGLISKAGKAIAKEFGLTAIYLMQLNRRVEGSADKKPMLSDLRGSGELEQDADTVLFIHRPDYYAGAKEEGVPPPVVSATDLIAAKNREGVKDDCMKLMFKLSEQKFYAKSEYREAK